MNKDNIIHFIFLRNFKHFSTSKIIKVSDRATLFNLLIGLDGYTISTGIISEELNGKNIIAIPLAVDETIKIGYIVRNDTARSYLGQIFIEALKQNTQELMQGV